MNLSNTAPEATGKPSALAQVLNIFVAPGEALDYARQRPGMWWLPLGIMVALSLALGLWWALTLNLQAYHLAEIQLLTRVHPENAGVVSHYIMQQGRSVLILETVVGTLVALPVLALLYALYLFLADKILSADSMGFGQWFSLTSWTWMPAALGTIAGMVALPLSHKTGLQAPNITSLNTLFLHVEPSNSLYRFSQFSILNFWIIGLVTYGLKRWRGYGIGKSLAIAIAPYVVIYAIMYLI